jgi:hypothetical protein
MKPRIKHSEKAPEAIKGMLELEKGHCRYQRMEPAGYWFSHGAGSYQLS